MKYHLAQFNIAQFRLPQEHPDNADFINSLDRVNEVAEAQPGFVWRFTGDGNDALDVRAFDDPNMVVNMSVWEDLDALGAFVLRNNEHLGIMRRRHEWFEKVTIHLVLWWVEEGHLPSLEEAKQKLEMLEQNGPSEQAFTFRKPSPPPSGETTHPVMDECA